MKLKLNLMIVFTIFLFSCESSPSFSSWYEPWPNAYDPSNSVFLKEEEEPRIIESNNVDNDFFEIRSNYYYCVGETSFNGTDEDHTNAIKVQCRQNGATLVLYGKVYTDTRSGIVGSGSYISSYNIQRYDHRVYYFVSMATIPEILKYFGADCNNLSSDLRQMTGRNTGVYINIVYNESPAFYANLQRNDVIIRINEHSINNEDEFYGILLSYNRGETIDIGYIRNNQYYEAKVKLN